MKKLYFATDIHGSEICWKKFLASAAFYEAEVLVLGGDLSGKAIVPVITEGSRASGKLLGSTWELETEAEILAFEKNVSSRGYYPVRMSPEERDELLAKPELLDARFMKELLDTLQRWISMAEERLPQGVRCFVCPGNDDPPEVDALFAQSPRIENTEGRAVELGKGFSMVSTGWTNHTPWATYREEDETALADRIARAVGNPSPHDKLLFNLHCPPYASGLDDAPEMSEDFTLKNAGQSTVPVGSRAVREAIEMIQPLLSLHGHIHEAKGVTRLGRTLCVNPGSLYEQGVLQGLLVDLDAKKGIRSYALTTG
jgi:Icc-related predicted phosphoesterase